MKKICYPSASSSAGGSNISTMLLAENFSKEFEAILVYPDEGDIFKKIKNKNIKYEILPTNILMRKLHKYISSGWHIKILFALFSIFYELRVIKFIYKNKFDLIHTNDLMSTLLWGFAGKILGVPVIWHVRQEKSSKLLDKLRLYFADRLIFVAKLNTRKFSDSTLDDLNYDVVYNGVDLKEFNGDNQNSFKSIRSELNLEKDKKIVGFIGHLFKRKRPEMFVRAGIEIIKNKNIKDVHFIIIGSDSSKEEYNKKLTKIIKEEGVEDYFSILGFRNDIASIMSSLDIFVLTSTYKGEAFPRVIIESMASKTAVVSTKAAGVPEAIKEGETGFMVDPDDFEGLVSKIVYLLENPNIRNEFSIRGREVAENKFDSKKIAHQVEGIYNKLFEVGRDE